MIDRRRFSLGLAAIPLVQAAPRRGAAARPAPLDISSIVAAERERAGIPALGGAAVSSGGLQAIGVAGKRAIPSGPAVTPGDRWHLGSCTKAFTAVLAARLIERGLLRWEATIAGVLGTAMPSAWHDVQLLWLLSHRSGAANNFDQALWNRTVARGGTLRGQRARIVAEGLKAPPEHPPNTRTSYSNAGFLIAGAMIEAAANADWETLVRREIFAPLGMREAGFGAPGTPGALDQPLGHVRGDRGRWRRVDLGPGADIPAAAGPAGTIHASLPDWARFAAAHLRGQRGDASYLSRASWRRLHTPGGPDWGYSPGWIVAAEEAGPILRHLGSNNHFVAQATLVPARDLAVLLVTNVGDDAAEPAFRSLDERLRAAPVRR